MDRERKLLYTVAALALILEVMTIFALETESDLSSRAAALEEIHSCQQHLFRAWEQCGPRHFRRKDI